MIKMKAFVVAMVAVTLLGTSGDAKACTDTQEKKVCFEVEKAVAEAEAASRVAKEQAEAACKATKEQAKASEAQATVTSIAAKEQNNFATTQFIFPTPVIPAIPEIPAIPAIPAIPEIPVIPELPETPVIPEFPVIPEIPETPVIPVNPVEPELPSISDNLISRFVDPNNGDIIETYVNAQTNEVTTNVICARKDAADTITITSPSGTDTTITGDGDTFKCNVGYYGNAISPVNTSPDYKSSIKIQLRNSSVMTGEINSNNKVQFISLTIDKSSKWIVEGTAYLTVFMNEDTSLSNIVDNGNTIYYDSSDSANGWLEGKTHTLSGGGKLMPIK